VRRASRNLLRPNPSRPETQKPFLKSSIPMEPFDLSALSGSYGEVLGPYINAVHHVPCRALYGDD
jgi:hypothetical protein